MYGFILNNYIIYYISDSIEWCLSILFMIVIIDELYIMLLIQRITRSGPMHRTTLPSA